MSEIERRSFLQMLAAAGAAAAALPASIEKALAIPANNATGTIADVEHIVILTQENRSFDQYFGALRGVRGFSDPRAVKLPNGDSVWKQPTGAGSDYVMPFHAGPGNAGLRYVEDVGHGWTGSQAAWNLGKYDQWVPAKGSSAMIYYTRNDIPYHYALADAFTICDAYHCSVMGPTDPNRYYMWTGWLGNDGNGGGPVVDNSEAGYDWSSYPERLTANGISWKVYQDVGVGLTGPGYWGWTSDPFIGNYGDNSLLYLHQYQNAPEGSPLALAARTGTNISAGGTLFDQFRADVMNGTLPQVSYIAAPEAFSEHPNWPPNFGAYYVSQILNALTANPAVWSKTVLLYNFDEAGGFFDHVVPPTVPPSKAQGRSTVSTENEIFPGSASYASGPYGLGTRVPMLVISPWSKGGFVCSELFDHTSVIQFIETRFGAAGNASLFETNISPWRRAVTGDLTSAFDFTKRNAAKVALPSTAGYAPKDHDRHDDFVPQVPATQRMPKQEPGIRFARALPYAPRVHATVDTAAGALRMGFSNDGAATIVYQVRSGNTAKGPWTYTVSPNAKLSASWDVVGGGSSLYDLSVYGPNGFLRAMRGSVSASAAQIDVRSSYEPNNLKVILLIANLGAAEVTVNVANAYTKTTTAQTLAPGASVRLSWDTTAFYGWYDLTVTVPSDSTVWQQLAGHIENGKTSASDPMLGGLGATP